MKPNRPLSWSQISAFSYDPDQWYRRYVLGEKTASTPAMDFGKTVGEEIAKGISLIPVTRLPYFEYKLEAEMEDIPLVGYVDSYEPHTKLLEYKTSQKNTTWTQEKVDAHKQLDMYALMIFLKYAINPKDIHLRLEYIPVRENGDFTFSWTGENPIGWDTKRTLVDILKFGNEIKKTLEDMKAYASSRA